ncbi:uncharacterized protein K02A2.6-like [Pectinophora gossypiella]|uniref:uncharacterized protein K02A2.6-like n=1 Tax=Pectinophora gossypiella TaxID=13191 RepID=UPI00214EE701|nr:uncharacterized protein K02A2.6-like [Pectinophora gossypiella]
MPIGKLEAFNLSSKQWPAYIRRVNQYILLNEIEDERKVALLITVVGEATYSLMCDLCSPAFPEDKKYDELVKLVTDHLEPQRSEIAERHVFRLRRQRADESLTEYLQALKHLAATCNFGKCEKCSTLEENLRDQFVSGLANDMMRSRIFAEKSIRYKEAVELALALEAAEKHAEVSGTTGASVAVTDSTMAVGDSLHYGRIQSGGRSTGHGPSAGRSGGGGASGAGRAGQAAAEQRVCWRCGKPHPSDRCRYKNYSCDECGVKGHLKSMCKRVRDRGGRQNYVSEESEDDMFNIKVAAQGNKPYFIKLSIDRVMIECEIDTGSRISAISEKMYREVFDYKKIKTDNIVFRDYSGLQIESLGYIEVDVRLGQVIAKSLKLYIIKGGARPLLGREWMRALKITQINLNEIVEDGFVNRLCNEYPEVFSDKLGTCKRPIQLQLTDSEPVYVRARQVPLSLRARVERELSRLDEDGTIYRVDYSDYGTPIVPVVKQNGEIRICGDYKVTINPKLKRDYYPLPRIDELFANLSGGEKFSKIDLRHAYEQCLLTSDSQRYTAITTHMGTFAYRRTPYGLSCVPEKFQKIMEETLRGVPGCVVFLDDICVTGSNKNEHIKNLRAVLERLRDMGLTVKLSKCSFLQDSVKYLGFIINKEGLRPDPSKLDAISNAPRPENVTQLKSFLGMLNYYGRFIPNLSTMLHPLHALLKKGVDWKWNVDCEKSFEEAKRCLLSERVLAHYEEGRELVLSVDSSAYGLGAVLAHRYAEGERPISCVSRTLNAAERGYSQLDKEALAIIFGVTKHHQYLFGRRFTLRTDHQPLVHIFGDKGGIPQTAASRLQRWAARLAAYDFKIEFVRSVDNGPADALSRLPLARETRCADTLDYLNLVKESLPISCKEIARATEEDAILSKIKGYVMFGWPPSGPSCDAEKPYFSRMADLIVEQGCLIYKYRIVIPDKIRKHILSEIHEGHLGMNKMKCLSRSYVYWPNLDSDIETLCRACDACRAVRDAPPRAQLHAWEFPLHPWQRVHADFADCAGVRYLILVDAHSKWIEVVPMRGTDAGATTGVLRHIFARFGLPSQLVTDNGPPFLSHEFKLFCQNNCIKHVTSAPYRPQGNGAAENAVKTVKKAIKRALHTGEDVNTALGKFLLQYRNCNHATTGVSPAVALQGRRLRSRLDALRPDRAAHVRAQQERQAARAGGSPRSFTVGDTVLARDYTTKGDKWAEGRVVKVTGPVSYRVSLGNGVEWRRHADQIIPLENKSRYSLSLSRREFESEKPVQTESSEANGEADGGLFEDATGGEGEQAQAQQAPRSPEMPRKPEVLSPPPPSASARALRAYERAKRALLNIIE